MAFLAIVIASTQACAADDPSALDAAAGSDTNGGLSSRWSLDFESAYAFYDARNPWFLLVGQNGPINRPNPFDYHLNTYVFGARYDLTKVGGWSFLRGYWQSSFGATYSDILQGPEHYYAGIVGGLRYIFVPGDGTWSPYVELRGGVGATDASHVFYGQQADLAFTYLMGLGLRYQPNSRWRFSLGILDQHLSDLYLKRPDYGFDSAGFIVSVEWRRSDHVP
jgi:Lipid A 3-O-deacylase (PagL)